MFIYDGKEYRNLEEQVQANKKNIELILYERGVLNQFGIKIVGVIDNVSNLPDPTTYLLSYAV